ncbi:MAG TPA: hypothetical protein VN324_06935 [Quisquiliibacterium sp.]|nr:hypothetical protein [Quisquiliibacterium sp.]
MSTAPTNKTAGDAAPDVPIERWGLRLTDALRAELRAGNFSGARGLAVEGDGQARSLAGEYTLMVRGLGITIGVILGLLERSAREAPVGAGVPLQELRAMLDRFRRGLDQRDPSVPAPPAAPSGALPGGIGPVEEPVEACVRAAADALARASNAFLGEREALAQRVVQAIDQQDAQGALALVDTAEQAGYLPLHDRLVRFMADSFAWVLRHEGPAGLLRFHLDTAEGQRAGFDKWERSSAAAFAWTSAFLLKQHMGEVTVLEDDEKFTIEQTPCGSGGRLLRDGAYEGAGALPFVEAPGPLTIGRARLPVYCSHCPVWNGVAPLRWYGRAHWVFADAARADGGCTLHIYKRRDGTPDAYVAALGES